MFWGARKNWKNKAQLTLHKQLAYHRRCGVGQWVIRQMHSKFWLNSEAFTNKPIHHRRRLPVSLSIGETCSFMLPGCSDKAPHQDVPASAWQHGWNQSGRQKPRKDLNERELEAIWLVSHEGLGAYAHLKIAMRFTWIINTYCKTAHKCWRTSFFFILVKPVSQTT